MKRFYFLFIIICSLTGQIIAQNPLSSAVQIDTNYTPSATFKSTLVTPTWRANVSRASTVIVVSKDYRKLEN